MRQLTERETARCLILERHAWETGFGQGQLQIPLKPAEEFFGAGDTPRPIRVRLALNQANPPVVRGGIS